MAAGYVDDHRLTLYRDGTAPRDITPQVSDMTLTDDLDTLAAELTFTVLKSPRDKYMPQLGLAPGDKVRVSNHDHSVFSGIIVSASIDGAITAYDRGWYLNKSEIVLQVNGDPQGVCQGGRDSRQGVQPADQDHAAVDRQYAR